ncbi:MAG: 3-oxosteroid 1-dehydrogenase [Rhodothermales bacterium]|jgi:3-oxosteroid 1-dehydrogenase
MENAVEFDDDFDVIVLGSGVAGLATALAAAEKGLSSLLIEKMDEIGGASTESYGIVWMAGNHLAEAAGHSDDRDDAMAYMEFMAGGEGRAEHLQAFVHRGPEALQFFEDCGVKFSLIEGMPDHYYGMAPGAAADGRSLQPALVSALELGEWRHKIRQPEWEPCCFTMEEQVNWGGINRIEHWDQDLLRQRRKDDLRGKGVGLVCQLLKCMLDRDVPILMGQNVERLLLEDDRVIGVQMADGRKLRARKGVALATGGYESNPDLIAAYDGFPEWRSTFPDSNVGDGLVLASEQGAAVHVLRNNLAVQLCFDVPPENGGRKRIPQAASIVELCSPHTILVNREGERFSDEVFFQDVAAAMRHFDVNTHRYINLPTYLIFDSQYTENYSFLNRMTSEPIPEWVARDDTLRGLAEKLNIEPVKFGKSVARFNQLVEQGQDKDFHRGERAWKTSKQSNAANTNPTLGSLSKAPFYGVQLHPTGGGSAGVLTDEYSRVIHQRRRPIPGLYAVGMTSAKLEFGTGYQCGFHHASAMTFGYLAVGHMLSLP